jgi:phosphoserine phosphatase RsbX
MVNSDFKRCFEYGIAARTIAGEEISGDHCLTRFHSEGALFAVIDGAGHGSEAALASAVALSTLEAAPHSPPGALFSLCHEALRSTRGAAISLASISTDFFMSWAGVGNVDVVLSQADENRRRKKETLLLRNGVVGYQFSPPRVSSFPLHLGDMLIFSTDGVGSLFLEEICLTDSCQATADLIMKRYEKGSDDALVLVVRIVGRVGEGQICP